MDKTHIIIVGSNRCGTTSLFQYLANHPEISSSYPKMTGFFLPSEYKLSNYKIGHRYENGNSEAYLKYFKKHDSKYFLEASPDYLYANKSSEYILDFKQTTDVNLKMIALVRNPSDRFISMFYHLKKLDLLKEETTLSEFLNMQNENQEDLKSSVLYMGHYHTFLKSYKERFNENEFRVFDYGQLKNDPKLFMKEICGYLELDDNWLNELDFVQHNKGVKSPKTTKQKIYLKARKSILKFTAKMPALQRGLKNISSPVRKDLFTNRNETSLVHDEELMDKLGKHYSHEADNLQKMFKNLKLNWN